MISNWHIGHNDEKSFKVRNFSLTLIVKYVVHNYDKMK